VHRQILNERDERKGVLLVSMELEEILSLSDRILVIFGGQIVAEFKGGSVTEEELGVYMTGGGRGATGTATMNESEQAGGPHV